MKRFQKVLFALTVIASFGAVDALAQCTITSTSPLVRSQGRVELLGSVTVSCAVAPGVAQASVSVLLQPATTLFATTASVPDFMSTFPRPALTGAQNGVDNLCGTGDDVAEVPTSINVIGSGTNTVTVTFNPLATTECFFINGLRADINTSGLPSGSVLSSTVITGGSIAAITNTLIVGVVQSGFGSSSSNLANNTQFGLPPAAGLGAGSGNALSAGPLAIAACGPGIRTPSSAPSTFAGIPLVAPQTAPQAAALALAANAREGFINAWEAPEPDSLANLAPGIGTRIRFEFTGIPSGITLYVPEQVSGGPGAGLSAVTTGTATATLALTRVGGVVAADGSGGALVAAVANQFDKITVSAGTATVVYEVIAESSAAQEAFTILFAFTGGTTVGTGTIAGSISLAPVGPTSANPAVPQFAAGSTSTVVNVSVCASYLLFPWVANTGDGAYDTGFAIANTTADTVGTTAQTGNVTLNFFRNTGTNHPPAVTIATGLAAGGTATAVLSQVVTGSFLGYVIAVCDFQMAHGFAFLNSPSPATGGQFAQGYLAISVNNPRLGAPIAAIESAGH